MRKLVYSLLIILGSLFLVEGSSRLSLWPQPTEVRNQKKTFEFSADGFVIDSIGHDSPILSRGIQRYSQLIKTHTPSKKTNSIQNSNKKLLVAKRLNIQVLESDLSLNEFTRENYTLQIDSPNSLLVATTVYGALRGLETFSQLIVTDKSVLPKVLIKDRPRFSFRGVYLDTSAHFINLPLLYLHIDTMAASKLNVLHWRLNEPQPSQYRTPFSALSSFLRGESATSYSRTDLLNVVKYARDRGIRVLPEFSLESTSRLWTDSSTPEPQQSQWPVRTKCYDERGNLLGHGPFNPTRPETFKYLDMRLRQVGEIFTDEFVHLGGHSGDLTCWLSNEEIIAWLEEHSQDTEDPRLLDTELVGRVLALLRKRGKTGLVWEEIVDESPSELLKSTTIVDVRRQSGLDRIKSLTKKYRTVISAPWTLETSSVNDVKRWQVYLTDPLQFGGSAKKILGGKISPVSQNEQESRKSLETVGLVAERFWSQRNVREVESAKSRYEEQAVRLRTRGIFV